MTSQSTGHAAFLLSTLLLMHSWAGCAKPPATPPSLAKTQAASLEDADESVTARVRPTETYAQMKEYSDQVEMQLTYHLDDGTQEVNTTSLTTKFLRPNFLSYKVVSDDNEVAVVSDGKQISARIVDPLTGNFANQVVVVDAPTTLSIAKLYEVTELVDPIAPDVRLSALMGAAAGIDMTPLSLLLGDGKLTHLLRGAVSVSSVAEDRQPVESDSDWVAEQDTPEGTYRFIFSSSRETLRRIEFPTSTENLPPGISRVELIADIHYTQERATENDFAFEPDGQRVSHFVLPPLPLTTALLGKSLGDIAFANASGRERNILAADEQLVVLTWVHDHPSSRVVVEQLTQVDNRFDNPRIRFVYLSAMKSQAAGLLARWGSESSEAWFDRDTIGRDLLNVTEAPTTVVLGENNSVQYFGVGANPNVGNDIAVVLEKLLAGENVAKETLKLAAHAREAYRQQLALAKSGDGREELIAPALPAPTTPERLSLAERWKNTDLSEPGSMLVLPGKKQQILVTEGWNQVAVVSPDGTISRRIKLDLPDDSGITLIRAGRGERDRALIAAGTKGGRRVFVFDFAGKLVMQYPRLPRESLVGDFAVADLDANGDPEVLVAWQGNAGVEAIALDGQRRWTNRVLPGIASLTVSPIPSATDQKSIIVVGDSGLVYMIDAGGRTVRELTHPELGIHHAVAWPGTAHGFPALMRTDDVPMGINAAIHCCFSLMTSGESQIVGKSRDWKAIWTHTLPGGAYQHQLDQAQSIELPSVGPTWVFAGADGSMHFVSVDGQFTDSFFVGSQIRGFAGMRIEDSSVLVLATDHGVAAVNVSDSSSER